MLSFSFGSTVGKKLLNYAIVAFIIYFVAFRPDAAAKVVRGIGGLLSTIAVGFGNFFAGIIA
jgi:hypothetical protein